MNLSRYQYQLFIGQKLCQINIFISQQYQSQNVLCSQSIMILCSSYSVKLSQKYKKILYLYTAYNETFVFLALVTDRQDAVVHVDKEGKQLFRHFFKIPMEAMAMLSEREVLFAETRRNRIACLDLQTHEFAYYPHQFMNEESDQSDLFTFSQTRYLCLEEKGRYNDNRYKLTYFQYPLQIVDKKTRTIAVYQAKDSEWTYQHVTRKANNYSMMCWYKSRHDDYFQFKLYELQGGKGQYINYKINNSIAAEMHTVKMQVAIFNAWELKRDSFLFVCLTNKIQGKKGGGTVINDNYVIDFKNKQIRESQFTFGPFQNTLIDHCNLGAYSMFRTYRFEEGKAVGSPTYYIENQSERVIAEQSWQCSYLYKYQFPGYGSGYLCEGLYENVDVQSFTVNLKRLVPVRQLYIYLMSEQHVQLQQQFISVTLVALGVV